MRKRTLLSVVALAAAAATTLSYAQAPAATTKFDGTWGVTLVCADYKDAGAGAKGYTFRFLAHVKDGQLEAQYGTPGEPSSLHYSGTIQEDGSAEIQAKGRTGNPDYTVGRVVRSTPYAYRMRAKFDATRGNATRLDLRPCEATFVKQ
jgi:hypothetical protein